MSLVNAPLPREQDQEMSRERRRLRWILLGMAFLSLSLAAIFGRHGVLDVARYRAERDRMKAEITQMEVSQRALEAEVAAIRKDPAALERIAREDLTLARKGEVVIILKPAAELTSSAASGGASGSP